MRQSGLVTADEPRPTLRPIPRWVISAGLPVMVLVAVAVTWLLLAFALGGDQLDAIRTGGTLGVGLGGAVALWLAVRKQRSTELDLLQKYEAHQLAERAAAHTEKVAAENHAHQLRLAADAHEDATARRITELYGKGVDQLGSDKAPVRLGGLYALERLGQDSEDPRLRQTIVNVICAYLRMPPRGSRGRRARFALPRNDFSSTTRAPARSAPSGRTSTWTSPARSWPTSISASAGSGRSGCARRTSTARPPSRARSSPARRTSPPPSSTGPPASTARGSKDRRRSVMRASRTTPSSKMPSSPAKPRSRPPNSNGERSSGAPSSAASAAS